MATLLFLLFGVVFGIVGGIFGYSLAVTFFLFAYYSLYHAPPLLEPLEKIVVVENQIEADLLDSILTERKIPHFVKTYEDRAFGGLFWIPMGWGHLEAPAGQRKEVEDIIAAVRNQAAQTESNTLTGAEPVAPGNSG